MLTVDGSVTETTFKPSDDTKQPQEAPGFGLSIQTASPTTLCFLADVEMGLKFPQPMDPNVGPRPLIQPRGASASVSQVLPAKRAFECPKTEGRGSLGLETPTTSTWEGHRGPDGRCLSAIRHLHDPPRRASVASIMSSLAKWPKHRRRFSFPSYCLFISNLIKRETEA